MAAAGEGPWALQTCLGSKCLPWALPGPVRPRKTRKRPRKTRKRPRKTRKRPRCLARHGGGDSRGVVRDVLSRHANPRSLGSEGDPRSLGREGATLGAATAACASASKCGSHVRLGRQCRSLRSPDSDCGTVCSLDSGALSPTGTDSAADSAAVSWTDSAAVSCGPRRLGDKLRRVPRRRGVIGGRAVCGARLSRQEPVVRGTDPAARKCAPGGVPRVLL